MGLEKAIAFPFADGRHAGEQNAYGFRQRPAHFLVTTPESLAVMLAQESYAAHLAECQFVIVDELHSFAGNKRGADLTLSLERLERLRLQGDATRKRADRATKLPKRDPCEKTFRPWRRSSLLARFLVGEGHGVPDRRGAGGEEIARGSIFADPPKAVSTGGLHGRAALRGTGRADSPPPIGSRFHQCPLGRGTSRIAPSDRLRPGLRRSRSITPRSIAACGSKWRTG